MLLKLAQQYAMQKKTTVLAHREHDGVVTFVLGSGPKLTMSEAELRQAIALSQKQAAPPVIDISDGVDAEEASAAGKALAARKFRKQGDQ